ncbi:MAG: hypothetical protein QM652_10675, partial [Legionella sp.]|uniref:hypothetical protein n=1 Tax=Legionella sp. TaxID=459 RepID=UPI0039E60765
TLFNPLTLDPSPPRCARGEGKPVSSIKYLGSYRKNANSYYTRINHLEVSTLQWLISIPIYTPYGCAI